MPYTEQICSIRAPCALAYLCRAARCLGGPAERLATNGNRLSLIRQHRLLLSAYTHLLSGQPPPPGLQQEIESMRNAYRSADDLPASGNLAAALVGRPGAQPVASGEALLLAIQRILDRL